MKKLIIQANYLLLWTDINYLNPNAVFSAKNTVFNFNADTGAFEIKEAGGGAHTFTNAEINSGLVLGDGNIPYTQETLFTFLTENSANFNSAPGGSGAINYSNVLFVDPVNGNDLTALPGRFDLPFSSILQATNIALGLGATATSKVLIHIRKGLYFSSVNLANYVDYYCEPGVVFNGTCIVKDVYGDTISNFLGHAVFLNSSLNNLELNNTSTINFEFDYISCNGRAFGLIAGAGKTVTANIKGNYIYCSTFGTGHGLIIRNNVNLTMNISREIEAVHSTIAFSTHSGNVVINCPKIYLGTGNIYGGNFKQAVIVYGATSTSNITINGDLENKDSIYYGGISGVMCFFGADYGTFTINGNIYGKGTLSLNGRNTGTGSFTLNGNTSSDYDQSVWCYGAGKFKFVGGSHILSAISTGTTVAAVDNTAEVYFIASTFYNPIADKNLININGLSCFTNLSGCTGESVGVGYSVSTIAGGGNISVHSSRFNKAMNPLLADIYVPSGFILDINIKVPKF